MIAQRNALRITITIIKSLSPVILRLLKQVQAAKDPNSPEGKKITQEERWEIAYNAAIVFLPEIIDAISDSIK